MFENLYFPQNQLDFDPAATSLQQGLLPDEKGWVSASAVILIPRATCSSVTHLCAMVEPGANSSYSLPQGSVTHILCLDLTPHKNCIG